MLKFMKSTNKVLITSLLILFSSASFAGEYIPEKLPAPVSSKDQTAIAVPGVEAPAQPESSISFGELSYKNGDMNGVDTSIGDTVNINDVGHFGWMVIMHSPKTIVSWKEEIFIKKDDDPITSEFGRLIKTTERRSFSKKIMNDLFYGKKLSPGHYFVRVSVGDEFSDVFEFFVTKGR